MTNVVVYIRLFQKVQHMLSASVLRILNVPLSSRICMFPPLKHLHQHQVNLLNRNILLLLDLQIFLKLPHTRLYQQILQVTQYLHHVLSITPVLFQHLSVYVKLLSHLLELVGVNLKDRHVFVPFSKQYRHERLSSHL